MRKVFYFIWDIVKVVVISLVIVVPIRYFIFQPFFVRGASMDPNFHDGQYLIIDEISPRFKSYQRGEVVVFKFPNNPSQFYIKRIIGMPEETIEIQNGKITVINQDYPQGLEINESDYLAAAFTLGSLKATLDENEYFVLGDNRNASSDSRRWGSLNQKNIIGRVFLRAWPINKLEIMENPQYQNLF